MGRLGGTYIPHGIDIITLCDYVSISSSSYWYMHSLPCFIDCSYHVLIPLIASYPEYFSAIVHYIYTKQIYNTDAQVREFAADVLFLLFEQVSHDSSDQNLYIKEILPSLMVNLTNKYMFKRIGSIQSLVSIIKALYTTQYSISDSLKQTVYSVSCL